jgi:type II secretory pathway component PulF
MPFFNFSAVDASGRSESGRIEALSESDAYRRLRERGLQPGKITAEGDVPRAAKGKSARPHSVDRSAPEGRLPRLTGKQLLFFTEELAELLDAGLQLEGALKVIEQRQERSPVKIVASRLRQQVREGVGFSTALRGCGKSFDPLYCNLVAAGEAAGALPQILKRQCAHLEMVGELGKKVTSALVYPAIVFSSAILLMFSLFCGHYWWAILLVIVGLAAAIRAAVATPTGRDWWHRRQLDVPVVGPVLKTRFFAEMTQNLSTLVSNGVSMLASLELMKGATSNVYLQGLLGDITALVREGSSLASALRRTGFFPPVLLDILGVGEQTGDLSGSLLRAAKRYDRELAGKIQILTTLIQPAVILIVALFVGVVAYSMISGILSSVNALRVR